MIPRLLRRAVQAALAIVLVLVLPAGQAQTYEEARDALQRQQFDVALAGFLKLAEKNVTSSYAPLGVMYYLGQGTAQDNAKARFWAEKAAAVGSTTGEGLLGHMMVRGEGGARDLPKGLALLNKAAESDGVGALSSLATLYYEGADGVARDPQLALKWGERALKKSALSSDSRARIEKIVAELRQASGR